jgi:hypothetical protein
VDPRARCWLHVRVGGARATLGIVAFGLICLAIVPSCTGTSCTTEARRSLIVTVLEPSGQRVCNAVVTVQDGSFRERLGNFGGPAACTYVGPTERKGAYAISAVTGVRRKVVEDVTLSSDACHVHPRAVAIAFG